MNNNRFPSYPNVFQGTQDPRSQLIAQSITRQQLKQQSTGYLSGGGASEFLDNSAAQSSGQYAQLYQQQQQQHLKMSTDRIRLSVHSPKESQVGSRQSAKRPHSSASSNQLGVILNNQSTHYSVMQSFTSDRKPNASSNSANNSYCIGQENLSQKKPPQQQQQSLIQSSAQSSSKSLLDLGATLGRMTAHERNSLLLRKGSQPSYSQPFQLQQEQPTQGQTNKGTEQASSKQQQSSNGIANRQMLSEQSQNVLTDESQATTSIPNKPNKSLSASATATATARIASSYYGPSTNSISSVGLTPQRPSQQLRADNASVLIQSHQITREQQSQQQLNITEQLNYKQQQQQTYLNNLQPATAAEATVSLQQYSPEAIHVSPKQSQQLQQQQQAEIQQQYQPCCQNQRANQENNQSVLNNRYNQQQSMKHSSSTSPCISITNVSSMRTSLRNLGNNNNSIHNNNDIQQPQTQSKSTNSLASSPSVPRNAFHLNDSKTNSNNQITNVLLLPFQQQQSQLSGSIVVCQQPQHQLLNLNPKQLQPQQQQQPQRQPSSNYSVAQPQQQSMLNSLSLSSIQLPLNPSQQQPQQSQLLSQQNETIQLKESLHELTQQHQQALSTIESMCMHQADLEKTIKLLIQQNELLSQEKSQTAQESQDSKQLKSQQEVRVVIQEADKDKKSQAQNEEQIAMLMSLEVRISELVAENERINNILSDKEKQNSQYQLSSQILTSLIAEGQSEYRLKIQTLELEKLELRAEIRELRRKKEENQSSSALDLDNIVKGFEDKIQSLVQENERLSELLIAAVRS